MDSLIYIYIASCVSFTILQWANFVDGVLSYSKVIVKIVDSVFLSYPCLLTIVRPVFLGTHCYEK